jgi:enediyne biosynthesis protein E4
MPTQTAAPAAALLVILTALVQSVVEAQPPRRVPVPEDVLAPPWLESRREQQLATTGRFRVFHDFTFTDRVEESGILFRHRALASSKKAFTWVHYHHGNGVALADVDLDGRIDIYFVNQVGDSQLWRNLGGGRFADITDRAGVAVADAISVSAAFADIDNDGDPDLYVTTVRTGNRLLENDGTGVFKDISASSGADCPGHSSGAVFFDYDRDGLLDLFATNVGMYTFDELVTVTDDTLGAPEAYAYYPGLMDASLGHLYPERSESSILFRNMGDNRFADVSEEVGLVDEGWNGDATPLDVNDDGWIDLYVLNMQGLDGYYENVAGRRFVKKTEEAFHMTPFGSMGVKAFDYDNDGNIDLYVTDRHSDMSMMMGPGQGEKMQTPVMWPRHLLGESLEKQVFGTAFFRNVAGGGFRDVTAEVGAETYWPWGLSVGDLNADGYEDVFITAATNYPMRYGINSVLLNDIGDKFLDSEFILGVEPRRDGRTAQPWFELDCSGDDRHHLHCQQTMARGRIIIWGAVGSRSSALFDLDADGDLDIVTNDFNSAPMVLISNLSERRDVRFLEIELVGRASNRSGLGARVTVHVGDQHFTRVHDGKSGYLSQSLCPLYFGLGDAEQVDRIEVQWPSGKQQVVPGPIATGTRLQIAEN